MKTPTTRCSQIFARWWPTLFDLRNRLHASLNIYLVATTVRFDSGDLVISKQCWSVLALLQPHIVSTTQQVSRVVSCCCCIGDKPSSGSISFANGINVNMLRCDSASHSQTRVTTCHLQKADFRAKVWGNKAFYVCLLHIHPRVFMQKALNMCSYWSRTC